jgi:hypothetical protein
VSTCARRHLAAARSPHEPVTLSGLRNDEEDNMWRLADRAVKAVADVTLGTVIVLVHVVLAERKAIRATEHRLPS